MTIAQNLHYPLTKVQTLNVKKKNLNALGMIDYKIKPATRKYDQTVGSQFTVLLIYKLLLVLLSLDGTGACDRRCLRVKIP